MLSYYTQTIQCLYDASCLHDLLWRSCVLEGFEKGEHDKVASKKHQGPVQDNVVNVGCFSRDVLSGIVCNL